MFGYVYITENLINHKKYIGKKVSNKFLGDKYLGSGTYLKRAINKYGKENFAVKMLCSCNSSEELDIAEVSFIHKYDAVNSSKFYNLADGIKGNTRGSKKSSEWKAHMSEICKNRKHSSETKNKLSNIVSNTIWVYNADTDCQLKIVKDKFEEYADKGFIRGRRPLSEQHKSALSKSHKGKHKNFSEEAYARLKNNHNTAGHIWITNGVVNKLINVEDFVHYIGFHKGMTRSSTTIESGSNK